jgi:uncharacterized membrane protein YeiH
VILSREIYVSAALIGAVTFASLAASGTPRELAVGAGFTVGFFVRAAALYSGWSLPRYRQRPGQRNDATR